MFIRRGAPSAGSRTPLLGLLRREETPSIFSCVCFIVMDPSPSGSRLTIKAVATYDPPIPWDHSLVPP